ncbi:unnamed protein product [Schistocephalus solidus]|uniref:Pept_C1 domain-containing protein n=1 Tax=Schistocephalus solidus TaxID=70667 RepID=A0A183T3F7_SCHSO|nr:unnamed protein product [Schistocephalus solidus]
MSDLDCGSTMLSLPILILPFLLGTCLGDTPANCTYEDARGLWTITLKQCFDRCSGTCRLQTSLTVGFEANIANRKWLFMFAFDKQTGESICDKTLTGYSHNVVGKQLWQFEAVKKSISDNFLGFSYAPQPLGKPLQTHSSLQSLTSAINQGKYSWTATVYPDQLKLSHENLVRRMGGRNSRLPRNEMCKENQPRWDFDAGQADSKSNSMQAFPCPLINPCRSSFSRPRAAPSSSYLRSLVADLPEEFDWRSPPDGSRSPVTPVRDQGNCGSCYAFASTAALEARISLMTKGAYQPILSPQDVLDCSYYSEGCEGGFPYLIAGKYASDFGFTTEDEVPYRQAQEKCRTPTNASRHFSADYHYVGGYYGACNAELMQLELVRNGPFPVGFEVYSDFMAYKSGIYHHTGHQLAEWLLACV